MLQQHVLWLIDRNGSAFHSIGDAGQDIPSGDASFLDLRDDGKLRLSHGRLKPSGLVWELDLLRPRGHAVG